jgi:hypothetical protein
MTAELSKGQAPVEGNESLQKSSVPPASKTPEFKGYEGGRSSGNG